jgi:hypothetical protein
MGPDGKITANPGTSYQWNTNPDGSTSLTQKQNVQYADGSSGTISADLGVTSSAPGATSAAPGAVADTDPNSIPNPTNGGGNQNANVKYSTDSKGNTTCTDNSGRNIPCPSNKNSDQCSNSGMADAHGGGKGGYNTACSDAYSSVDTGQMVNTIGQAAGSITTTAAGQMAQAKAATASTQGASYAGAASTAEITGMNQLALGAANMYFGYKQYAASKAATAAATSATNDSAAKQKLVTQNQTAAKTATTAGQTDLATTYTNNAQTASKQMALFDAANPEETTAASKAKNGGIMSMVLGGLGIAGGGLELAAAQQYKNIANELNNINTAPALSIPADPFAQTPSAPAFAGTITGAGVASANPNYTPNPVPSGDLSGLVGPATGALPANALVAAAPSPGAFGANPSSGSGGGAGGGGLGGASTTDTKGDPEVQAKMAAQDRVNYEGGSASYGGGAAKSNAMGDKGTDLSSMLAALLPQKEEAQGPQNGILNYGNRSPASEGQYSYLDSRTNIFERVSNTYQDKTRQQKL